jgi:hypothetical protein
LRTNSFPENYPGHFTRFARAGTYQMLRVGPENVAPAATIFAYDAVLAAELNAREDVLARPGLA